MERRLKWRNLPDHRSEGSDTSDSRDATWTPSPPRTLASASPPRTSAVVSTPLFMEAFGPRTFLRVSTAKVASMATEGRLGGGTSPLTPLKLLVPPSPLPPPPPPPIGWSGMANSDIWFWRWDTERRFPFWSGLGRDLWKTGKQTVKVRSIRGGTLKTF